MPGSSPQDSRDGGDASSPRPSSPAADRMDSQRRLSTSSDASSSNDSAHKVDSTMDYIPTRMTKVSTPKPAANPLQFVKVGPCDLFKSAQETLKKVEEVKKMKKEVRDEAEDWQSNLDNWKCSRRKRVEHIIDRVVEVKKFELEEHERNRRKAKTFSEMMEERTSRGRKMSLLVHKDDDSNDLSDLGIGTSSDKSSVSEDYANDDSHSVDDGDDTSKNHFHDTNGSSKQNGKSNKITNNGHDDDTSTNTTASSPEPEEYTYDRAIQGYVNFTETRVKSRTTSQVSRTETENFEDASDENSSLIQNQPTPKPRRETKVEEDIAEIERLQSRKLNGSSSDHPNSQKKIDVPKVDILKRKELFERSDSSESCEQAKAGPRAAGDFVNSRSIRHRVSNLERQKSEDTVEKSKEMKQLSSEVSVKDRLSLLERQQSVENQTKSSSRSKLNDLVASGDDVAPAPPSIKDRLNSLEQVAFQDRSSRISPEIAPTTIKSRLSELEGHKELPKKVMPDRDPSFREKLANFRNTEQDLSLQNTNDSAGNSIPDSSAQFSSPDEEDFYRKRVFHRSLDSLDIDSSSVLSSEPYERVQSLEDLDSCGPSRNYPNSGSSNENLVLSTHSGDTDREDSGIHTADVSCSVSQADEPADFGDHMHPENAGPYVHQVERNMDYAPPTIVSQLAKINLTDVGQLETQPEVGPKPSTVTVNPNENLPFVEQDPASVNGMETDLDVSSFLDQALLEEDMKMGGSGTSGTTADETLNNAMCPLMPMDEVSALPIPFSLCTPTSAEPPKEKPPPPPVELSDEDDDSAGKNSNVDHTLWNGNQKPNLARLDSTKRLKKDIHRKRSDFLGIEGNSDDSYLDCELKVAPPPDMTSFLQEERRLEQELYRQMQPTLYPESDHGSNQGESRDSGVELDNHLHSHNLHSEYSHDQSCENHSRQNSEPFGNASSTSEEDEIIKKEREIIEILEKEEQWRYGTNTILSPSDHHQVGEKLAAKLRELEQEKMRLEWERAEEARKVAAEQAARQEEQRRIRMKEEQLRQQESIGRLPADVPFDCDPSDLTPAALREERERLKLEQAELERQRELLAANQVNSRQSWDSSSSSTAHRSLQDVSGSTLVGSHSQLSVPTTNTPLNYRLSLPDLQQSDLAVHPINMHHHRPPPPIPPAKPLSVLSQERSSVNGSSRQGQLQSSTDSLPLSSDSHHHRHNAVGLPSAPVALSPTSSTGSQQMTRQTLHALSATPRSKIIATDTWVQAKRKPESQRSNNRDHYQHWLIQEAEHRRITEQQQRNAASRKSLPAMSQSQLLQPKAAVQPVQQQVTQAWQYQQAHHHNVHQQMTHQHTIHPNQQHSHIPVQTTAPPVPPPPRHEKPLPDAIIQTLTQRVQNRASMNENHRRIENSPGRDTRASNQLASNNLNNNNLNNVNVNHNHNHTNGSYAANTQEKMLSVSGKKKCSHCNEELGRGAAMIIESLRLFYHMDCFKCCVCHVQLGDGLMGTDVRVRNHKLHCHNCYSSDDGVKFSCV